MTEQPSLCPLALHAIARPAAIALVEHQPQGGAILCRYDDLHHQVEQRRHWLQQQGIKPGQRLLVAIQDQGELLRLLIASLRLGCVLIPIDPDFLQAQKHALILGCDADGFIDESATPDPAAQSTRLDSRLLPERCFRLDLNALASIPRQLQIPTLVITHPDAPLSGVLTSGATGTPKLALHSYNNHLASAEGSRHLIPLKPGDGWGLLLPLYHIGGQAILFRCLLAGASLIIPAPAESREQPLLQPLLQLLAEPRLTHLSAVPSQLLSLQQANFNFANSTLQQLLLSGASLAPRLLRWLYQQPLQSWISYDLTEMSSQVMTGPPCASARLTSLLPHCQLRLSDENEILVKGASLFLGYYRKGRCHQPVDAQGWFHTGDLGQFDPQQQLSIGGRLDNQFISGGENIQPETIERALAAYPGIDECLVVPADDPGQGLRPVVFIRSQAAIDHAQLDLWLRQRLPSHQIPVRYLPMPTTTAALEPSRVEVRRLAAEPNP
ncbi:MAG: O-succinylbenzoic acid--CoA ligase [Motiliproteus sp.]|jgi:O-succinylbenzoic acid--CoA ligase